MRPILIKNQAQSNQQNPQRPTASRVKIEPEGRYADDRVKFEPEGRYADKAAPPTDTTDGSKKSSAPINRTVRLPAPTGRVRQALLDLHAGVEREQPLPDGSKKSSPASKRTARFQAPTVGRGLAFFHQATTDGCKVPQPGPPGGSEPSAASESYAPSKIPISIDIRIPPPDELNVSEFSDSDSDSDSDASATVQKSSYLAPPEYQKACGDATGDSDVPGCPHLQRGSADADGDCLFHSVTFHAGALLARKIGLQNRDLPTPKMVRQHVAEDLARVCALLNSNNAIGDPEPNAMLQLATSTTIELTNDDFSAFDKYFQKPDNRTKIRGTTKNARFEAAREAYSESKEFDNMCNNKIDQLFHDKKTLAQQFKQLKPVQKWHIISVAKTGRFDGLAADLMPYLMCEAFPDLKLIIHTRDENVKRYINCEPNEAGEIKTQLFHDTPEGLPPHYEPVVERVTSGYPDYDDVTRP